MFFKRNKKPKTPTQKLVVKPVDYPPKVLLAWSKSIEGDHTFTAWLTQHGFQELAIATYAIYLKDDARTWLAENGYPHLLAMINGAERDEKAKKWLKQFGFDLLYHMAEAIDDDLSSMQWLKLNTGPEVLIITTAIKKIKDQIEDNHKNIHYFGKDL